MSNITRELAVPPRPAGPLDVARFMPSEAELAFLKKVISEDEEEVKKRVLEAQRESV